MQTGLHGENNSSSSNEIKRDEQERELAFSEKLSRLEDVVTRHPLNRDILYETLVYCKTERALTEVEEFIATLPQFKNATQNQYRMIEMLEKAYGLTAIECDAEGKQIDPAIKESLSEDELDDLIAINFYETTEVGVSFVEQHKPKARIIELLNLVPERAETYTSLLSFIDKSPRTYDEVCAFLAGHPALETVVDGKRITMQPSVFLDKLERASALVWDGKWVLTKEGGEFLSELKDR